MCEGGRCVSVLINSFVLRMILEKQNRGRPVSVAKLLLYRLNNLPLALRRTVLIKCLEYPNFDLIHAHEFPIEQRRRYNINYVSEGTFSGRVVELV